MSYSMGEQLLHSRVGELLARGWVSCAQGADWGTSQFRHLLRSDGLTTLCNATASHRDVWRGNTRKPVCERCLESGKRLLP